MVDNIPFEQVDVSNSRRIFGPALEDLRGKTTRRKPDIAKEKKVSMLASVAERLKYVTMAAGIFFVDKIPFLITMTKKLQFVTAEFTPCRRAPKLAEHLKKC